MEASRRHQKLETELTAMLGDRFPGLTVEISHSKRWDRPCVKFRWRGFAELLPEERFHRLAIAIPEQFRESELGGFVWLELAPNESVAKFLKLPRSEDKTDKQQDVYAGLKRTGFFAFLSETLGPSPERTCPGDFSNTVDILSAQKFSAGRIRNAKLLFIRHGAYCDCQILQTVEPALAEHSNAGS